MNMPSPSAGTHHGRVPGFLPMSPADGLDQFRVTGTMAVRAMLRELQNAREHVVLYSADDDALHLVTRVEGLEAQDFRLTMAGSEADIEALMEAGPLTLVGMTGAVKIQLTVSALSLRDDGHTSQLIAAIPDHGWRIQRRDAFRVTPPEGDGATVVVRMPRQQEARGRLHDLSAGGLCFYWQASQGALQVGQTLPHSRIERVRAPALPCDLKIIRIGAPDGNGEQLVSCRFEALPEAIARRVQVYVMDVERRVRAVRND